MNNASSGSSGFLFLFREVIYLRVAFALVILTGPMIMSETLGLFLVIGFPLSLVICIWAFGRFSAEPK